MIRRMSDERGLTGGVQVTLLLPFAFGILLLTFQWALMSWGSSTALAAAQDGARAAAAAGAVRSDGVAAASAASANGSLKDVSISVERGPLHTTVTVTGHANSVLPGWASAVQKSVRRPTERLTSS